MKQVLVAMAMVAALAGCGGTVVSDPHRDVAAVELALTAADQVILDYSNLPVCGPGATALCRSKTVMDNMKAASHDAFTAIKNAEAAISVGGSAQEMAMQAAQTALAALQTAVTQAKGK